MRETICVKTASREVTFYARPTIIEEQQIKGEAGNFTSHGYVKLAEIEAMTNRYMEECIQKDEKGKSIEGEKPGTVKLDKEHSSFHKYLSFKNIVDSAMFYGKMKVLTKDTEDFNPDLLSKEEFYEIYSAFEVALSNFRERPIAA